MTTFCFHEFVVTYACWIYNNYRRRNVKHKKKQQSKIHLDITENIYEYFTFMIAHRKIDNRIFLNTIPRNMGLVLYNRSVIDFDWSWRTFCRLQSFRFERLTAGRQHTIDIDKWLGSQDFLGIPIAWNETITAFFIHGTVKNSTVLGADAKFTICWTDSLSKYSSDLLWKR